MTDHRADPERVYSVVISLKVRARSGQEAMALVAKDVKRHLYSWPARVEAATELVDGTGAAK